MSQPHWVCPAHSVCAFPVYTAQALGCCTRNWLRQVLGLVHSKPLRSKLLSFRFSGTPQRHRLDWTCVLCPSPVQAAQVTRFLVSCDITLPIPVVQFSGCTTGTPSRCVVCLLWGVDLWLRPSRRMLTFHTPRSLG